MPQPDSPTSDSVSPDGDREADVLDGVDIRDRAAQHAAPDGKARRQIPDLEQDVFLAGLRARPLAALAPARSRSSHRLGRGLAAHLAELGDGGEQHAGVVLARAPEDLADRAFLDDPAAIHHHHAVGHLRDDRHVVGDEQHRHAVLALQAVDQGEDFGLDRDVERGGRLVGDQQPRLAGHRHGDDDALAHAAGKLMRILPSRRSGSGMRTFVQQLERARPRGLAGKARVRAQAVGRVAARS